MPILGQLVRSAKLAVLRQLAEAVFYLQGLQRHRRGVACGSGGPGTPIQRSAVNTQDQAPVREKNMPGVHAQYAL